jgi:hypothetical protein
LDLNYFAWRIDGQGRWGQINAVRLKTIKEMRDAVPLQSFEIHPADGRAQTVATPDNRLFMPNNRELFVVLPNNGFCFIDLDQVVSIGRGPIRAKAH